METVVDDGRIVALAKVLRDRTDVRTQVVTLQNRLTAAEEQNLKRRQNVAAVAHELRNQAAPLANLLAAVEKSFGEQPCTAGMRRQLTILSRLLTDLAEEAALSPASPTLCLSDVDVQDVLRHAGDAILADTVRRGQTLKVTLPGVPIVIRADAHRLDQMVSNLLNNASKFTPKGGNIQLSATVEADMVAIRVEDDGNGIAPDVLPKVFELFTRGGGDGAPHGLGVGLAVVRNLTELHGGIVEGRSPGPGMGSVFTLRLPLNRRASQRQADLAQTR